MVNIREITFLTSGESYFSDIDHLDAIFVSEPPEQPDENKLYVAGLDLGRKRDYTALSILEKETGREVCLYRVNQKHWYDILTAVVDRIAEWGVRDFWVEDNNIGDIALEELDNYIVNHPTCDATLFVYNTNYKTKPKLVNQFHSAISNKDLTLLPDNNAKSEIYQYQAPVSYTHLTLPTNREV